MIGEVWFCSGQSNMIMKVSGNYNQPVFGSLDEIVKSENKNIRFFPVKVNGSSELLDDVEGNWLECNSSTTASFSAVAYFFGKLLNEVLDVPVGLIRSCMGGTPIEMWMSRDTLKEFDFVELKDMDTAWDIKSKAPTMYYNAMIHPFLGFGIKGVLWYQGESNAERPGEYAKLFPGMIESWRNNWDVGQFPFYYAQIAPHEYPRNINSVYLREVQLKTADIVPKVGMASLMDIGQKDFVHPGEKIKVGKRLAYIALAKTYGMKGFECFGPTLKDMHISNDTVSLIFNYASNGLATFGKELTSFKLAGSDKVFYPAKGKITKNEGLILTSDKVPNPVAVRYAFESFTIGELYNTFGLPASSFRTDDWDE